MDYLCSGPLYPVLSVSLSKDLFRNGRRNISPTDYGHTKAKSQIQTSHQQLSNEWSNIILSPLEVVHWVAQTWPFFDKLPEVTDFVLYLRIGLTPCAQTIYVPFFESCTYNFSNLYVLRNLSVFKLVLEFSRILVHFFTCDYSTFQIIITLRVAVLDVTWPL